MQFVLFKTKYTCLTCSNYYCMWCSVFENEEDTLGWKEGELWHIVRRASMKR